LLNGRLGDGDPGSAARNRARLVAALGAVAPAFGVDSIAIFWTTDGDYSGPYPDDADALLAAVSALSAPPILRGHLGHETE
jgi:hypothetical protein